MNMLEEMGAFFDARCESYEAVHLEGIDSGPESKRIIASFLPPQTRDLLDFGVGTGLELREIFRRFPRVRVVGIDLSHRMLRKLRENYPSQRIKVLEADYLSCPLGVNRFDAAVSVMTMHHYSHPVKTAFYRKVFNSLKPGGSYLESDYMLTEEAFPDAQREENRLFAEYERICREQGLDKTRSYHFDTPCTVKNQTAMLLSAGFRPVREVWRRKCNVLLSAQKPQN